MNKIILGMVILLGGLGGCSRQESETTSPTQGHATAIVSESHVPLLQKEADEFHRLYEAASITVLPASTREAIVHLINDSVRVIVTDRALNAEERGVVDKAGIKITETKIAEDALVLVVHQQNPVQNMTLGTLKDIVTRKITEWSRVPAAPRAQWSGPIEFVFTGRNSGAYELLAKKFLSLQEDLVPAVIAQTQKEVLDYVATHPRAFGVVSAACFYSVTRPQGVPDTTTVLRTLAVPRTDTTAVDVFVKLYQYYIHRGIYPFHYDVYMYFTSAPTRDAGPELGFTTFVASYPGQKIILDAGLVPATMPIRVIQTKQE
jgi:ABC-type phosphate transport system substrate-binding protein